MRFLGTLLLCLLASAAMADQMYKWVDSAGQVHYSQTPPPGTAVQAKSVDIQGAQQYTTDPQIVQQEQRQQQDAAAQAKADQHRADLEARNKAIRAQNCVNLKARLQFLEQSGRVFTVDADGNRHYISDEDHDKEEQDLKAKIAKDCSDSH